MSRCSDACLYLTKHDRPYITSRVEEKWFMCIEAAQYGLPLQFLFMGISWDYNPWASTPLISSDIRGASSSRYEPSGEPVFTNDLTWKGKASFMTPQTKHQKGKNLQMWKSQRLRGADEHDIGWSDLRGRDNDPELYLGFYSLRPFFAVYCKNKDASKISPHREKYVEGKKRQKEENLKPDTRLCCWPRL